MCSMCKSRSKKGNPETKTGHFGQNQNLTKIASKWSKRQKNDQNLTKWSAGPDVGLILKKGILRVTVLLHVVIHVISIILDSIGVLSGHSLALGLVLGVLVAW